jgi:hypothetical protein
LFDHSGAQIGIDQTAFGSVHSIAKRSNRNLLFAGEACEPRTFQDFHLRLPNFLKVSHNVLLKSRALKTQKAHTFVRCGLCSGWGWIPGQARDDISEGQG